MVRSTGIAILLLIGADHVAAFPSHFGASAYIGALFLALSVACVALCVGIMRRLAFAWYAGALIQVTAIALFVLSRTTGLPGYRDDDWLDPLAGVPLGAIALATEAGFLAILIAALAAGEIPAADRPGQEAVQLVGRVARRSAVETERPRSAASTRDRR